jgi:hypothetical protein
MPSNVHPRNRPPYNIDESCFNTKNKGGELFPSFNFVVILNGFTYGFQEVSGLERHVGYVPEEEGGNPNPIFIGKYYDSFTQLTFKRGILTTTFNSILTRAARAAAAMIPINAARKAALLAIAHLDPGCALEQGPAIGFIQVFDRNFRKDVMTLQFFSLGAVEKKVNQLDADSNGIMFEEITLLTTGVKRITNEVSVNIRTPGLIARTMDPGYVSNESDLLTYKQVEHDTFPPPSEVISTVSEEFKNISKEALEEARAFAEEEMKMRIAAIALMQAEMAAAKAEENEEAQRIRDEAQKEYEEQRKKIIEHAEVVRRKFEEYKIMATELQKQAMEAYERHMEECKRLFEEAKEDAEKAAAATQEAEDAMDSALEAANAREAEE